MQQLLVSKKLTSQIIFMPKLTSDPISLWLLPHYLHVGVRLEMGIIPCLWHSYRRILIRIFSYLPLHQIS